MMDVKEMVLASAEASRNLGYSQLLWTDKPEGKEWDEAFARIRETRQRCLESLDNPRVNIIGSTFSFSFLESFINVIYI